MERLISDKANEMIKKKIRRKQNKKKSPQDKSGMVCCSFLEAVQVSREVPLESRVELPIGYQEQSHKGQKKKKVLEQPNKRVKNDVELPAASG